MAESIITSPSIIIEEVTYTQVGSIPAGGSDTITKGIQQKTGYTAHVIDVHLSSGAVNSWAGISIGYTQTGNNIVFGITNQHTSALNPSIRCTIAYVHN